MSRLPRLLMLLAIVPAAGCGYKNVPTPEGVVAASWSYTTAATGPVLGVK
ncbi:MAG: hypothetical protein ABIP39_09610 [Polyangiaceae bacterium]